MKITQESLASIANLLASVNGARGINEGAMDLRDVLSAAGSAATREFGRDYEFNRGGIGVRFTKCSEPRFVTVALAARVDGKMYIGIGMCDSRNECTPGSVWPSLEPYSKEMEPKLREWTESANVIAVYGESETSKSDTTFNSYNEAIRRGDYEDAHRHADCLAELLIKGESRPRRFDLIRFIAEWRKVRGILDGHNAF